MNDLNELILDIARCGMEVNLKSSICERILELEAEGCTPKDAAAVKDAGESK